MANNFNPRGGATCARVVRALAIVGLAGVLSACVQQPKSLYSWQSYEGSVSAYLKDDGGDYATQTLAMEKNIETARAANAELPPGFRAHLGMLYLKMGDGDKGVEQMQGEKAAFPEAAPFMDFLLRNAGKPQTVAATGEGLPAGSSAPGSPTTASPAASPAANPAAPAEAGSLKKGS
ncbi:MAG: DUF4810 domain-containing protein, partial [Achromobacter mucicolens]